MKRVIVLLAEGFEEVEAVTPIDYLRRAGAELLIAGVGGRHIKSSRALSLQADMTVQEASGHWQAVIVPGGMPGASNIAANADCQAILKAAAASGAVIGAICAAPVVVLGPLGILEGRRFTCYPGMEKDARAGHWSSQRVVTDGNIITSRAPGTAGEWAITLVSQLFGAAAATKLAESVLLKTS